MYSYNSHTSWNPPHPGNRPSQEPSLDLDQRRTQYRPPAASYPYYATSPTSYSPQAAPSSHPSALRPGNAPSTTHRSDLFFASPPSPATSMRPSTSSGYPQQPLSHHYPHSQSFQGLAAQNDPRLSFSGGHGIYAKHDAPLQRNMTAPAPIFVPQIPPPIPPKISHHHSLLPAVAPPLRMSGHSHSAPAVPQVPAALPPNRRLPPHAEEPSSNNGDDLALALALSQSESSRHRLLVEKLTSQEEEDLAKALEESMRASNTRPPLTRQRSLDAQTPSDKPKTASDSISRAQTFVPVVPSPQTSASTSASFVSGKDGVNPPASSSSQISSDEALARKLATEVADLEDHETVSSPTSQSNISEDEAYVRKFMTDKSSWGLDDSFEDGKTPTAATFPRGVSDSSQILLDDEALARQLAAENDSFNNAPSPIHDRRVETDVKVEHSPRNSHDWMAEDEALARRLAAEDEDAARSIENSPVDSLTISTPVPGVGNSARTSPSAAPALSLPPSSTSILPTYDDIISGNSGTSVSSALSRTSSHISVTSPASTTSSALSPTDLTLSHSESSSSLTLSEGSHSSGPLSPGPQNSAPVTSPVANDGPRQRSTSQASTSSRTAPSTAPSTAPAPEAKDPPAPLPPPTNSNQFLDADLLRGVSIGFMPPKVTPRPMPMQGVMPNIVSLPYGRCPPLHLQAPNWRHLLKLMARMSGTRIEPTVEAMAVAKHTLHLRTVVQFVKPHHAAPEWRVVLWFTIDHPVPTSVPAAHRYTNGDVSMLPWTYTLSTLPAMLRDADSPISKFYVIPSTDSMPFPVLPISFPNLAMYLQAALEESRRYMSDSSSGRRKLAKMIDLCYPYLAEEEDEEDRERGSGVGGLFKRVMGRGHKNQRQGRGNDDTYELVTPFIADGWG